MSSALSSRTLAAATSSPTTGRTNGILDLKRLRSSLDNAAPEHETLMASLSSMGDINKLILLQMCLSERVPDGRTILDEYMARTGRYDAVKKLLERFSSVFKDRCIVLDVNANTGTILRLASEVAGPENFGLVIANNLSSSMKSVAAKTLTPIFGDKVRCTRAVATSGFPQPKFPLADVVIAASAVHHIRNGHKKEYLGSAVAAVKPGGNLILIEEWPLLPLKHGEITPIVISLYDTLFYPTKDMDELRATVSSLGMNVVGGHSVSLDTGTKIYAQLFVKPG